MNLAAIQIDIICIVMLALILVTLHHETHIRLQTKAFKMVLGWFLVFSAIDMVAQLIPQTATDAALTLIFAKIFSCSFVGLSWLMYIYLFAESNSYQLRKWAPLVTSPLIIVNLYALIYVFRNFGTGQVPMNDGLWITFVVVTVGYILAASWIAIGRAKKCKNKFMRRTYYYLAFVMFIPMAALGVQSHFMDIVISAPVMVLVMLHLYILSLQNQISTDPITGLNNKQRLITHLETIIQKNGSDRRIFLIQLEIDNLREISKDFGKATYERVVEFAGGFLKEQCKGLDVFLSRVNKGTFVIVAEKEEFAEIEALCRDIIGNSKKSKIQGLIPWKITFNIYWSEYGAESVNSIDDLFSDLKNHCINPPAPLPKYKRKKAKNA